MVMADWLAPAGFLALLGAIAAALRLMVRSAERRGAVVAQSLGLRPDPAGPGFVGELGGVPFRLIPNAWRLGEADPLSPPPVAPSSTGELMFVAAWPRPSAVPLYLESVAVAGRRHLPNRIRTGDRELDEICSLLAVDAPAAIRLITAPPVRSALLALHRKSVCNFEIDAQQVTLHGARHDRALELAHDAAELASLLARTSEERGAEASRPAGDGACGIA